MLFISFFFFTDPATTEIYTLSLHDALPIWIFIDGQKLVCVKVDTTPHDLTVCLFECLRERSEEHTSELQSQFHLVCRLLLEKKKKNKNYNINTNYQSYKQVHYNATVKAPNV